MTVIDPAFAFSFLALRTERIEMVVDSILRKGDAVERKALETIDDLTPTETALLLEIVDRSLRVGDQITVDDLRSSDFLRRVYDRIPCHPRDFYFEDDDFDSVDDERNASEYDGEEVEQPEHIPTPTTGYSDERLRDDLEQLQFDDSEDAISPIRPLVTPLLAILLDAHVRFGVSGLELLEYTFGRLRAHKAFEFENVDEDAVPG